MILSAFGSSVLNIDAVYLKRVGASPSRSSSINAYLQITAHLQFICHNATSAKYKSQARIYISRRFFIHQIFSQTKQTFFVPKTIENYVRLKALEVELEAVKKWNGQLPQQFVPNSAVPFLNLNK
jgi:hypothetical protein